MDRLTWRAIQANRMGLTYGKYMGLLKEGIIQEVPMPQEEPEEKTDGFLRFRERICKGCGKKFTIDSGGRKYCSEECKTEAARARARVYKQSRRKEGKDN